MTTDAVAILYVADAARAVGWYGRLGFVQQFEHRFGPEFPAYVGIRRDGAQVHLSEHAGDATPNTLLYVWVDDVDVVGEEFGVAVEDQPWGREVAITDPDGNRLRVAEAVVGVDVDSELGAGTEATLRDLETALWLPATRGDRSWMEHHLAPDFTEFGFSGRTWSRSESLDQDVGEIPVELPLADFVVRALGRDAAIVTYRTVQPRGGANRSSVWRRADGRWLLAFHQGTPRAAPAD